MGLSPGQDDPLNELMKPPADETPAQTMARRKRELDAQHVSDRIDDQLKKERSRAKKEKVTKVLLLGQAESGKSTTLKNFRLRYSPDDWEKERNGWRAVVQLNIVRSISLILRVLEAEFNGEPVAEELQGEDTGLAMDDVSDSDSVQLTDWHQMLMIRLAPLRSVEVDLKKRLGTGDYTQTIRGPLKASPFEDDMSSRPTRRMFEASVRSWQDLLDPGRHKMAKAEVPVEQDAITTTIAGCKDDMKSLWSDKAVRSALHRRKIRLPDSAGFFLNDLERIATRNYTVSDNDIVRSRLRTVGIQEYSLKFQKGWEAPGATGSATWEWRMYDVGGCRTLRSAWLPYFENVDAIIFLTPVSVFDENLWEDPNVNRLQDSTELWTAICSSKLLARTQIIHFLNKCDLLHRKLKRGAALNRYLPSYGDRPNEVSSVVKYLREKFKEIQKRCSPQPRVAYIYPTTVTDTEATAITLDSDCFSHSSVQHQSPRDAYRHWTHSGCHPCNKSLVESLYSQTHVSLLHLAAFIGIRLIDSIITSIRGKTSVPLRTLCPWSSRKYNIARASLSSHLPKRYHRQTGGHIQNLMLAKVVSHLKRRFQRQDARNSQPPELRRWSGFVDPFPHVAAGGYTKYYKSHGLLDDDHPVALPERTKSDNLSPTLDISSPRRLHKRVNPRPSVPPIQIPVHAQQLSASGSSTSSSTLLSTSHPPGTNVSIPNFTVSTTSTSISIIHRSSKMSLLGIPEGPAAATEFGKRRRSNNSHAKHASEGTGASLRRRKRRMLRTTEEHDPVIAFSIPGMLSGAPSENDHLERPPLEPSVGSNPTTPTTLCDDVDHVIPKPWTHEDQSSYKCGVPLSERPDSRASFRTARSEFDD